MRLSKGRSPPSDGKDAYHLPQPDGTVIHGKTIDALIRNVFEYRVRNNLDPGMIEEDIDRYYCTKWPSFCAEAQTGLGKSPKQQSQEMLNRVSRWASSIAHRMPRGGYALVMLSEAEKRASICAACPKNGGWRSGCGGCDATTLQIVQSLKQLKKTTKDGNLSACQIGGYENSAAAWLPTDALPITEAERAAMPVECWRKQIP